MFSSKTILAALALSLFTIIGSAYAIETVIFKEDFDSLELGPTIKEQVARDEVWTNEPPDGWTIENDLAAPGMPEWDGWAFADAEWWRLTADDQERGQFIAGKAIGTIAIADPDEWDDLGAPGNQGTFNSWLSTPPIKMSGVIANTLVLTFDSSWRPEDTQNAELTVSFDGGDEIVIMRMESSGTNTIYMETQNDFEDIIPDLKQVNETIEIDIPNPSGAKTVVITWAMLDATNDWWWAIDNISLKSTAEVTVVNPTEKLSTVWGAVKSYG